MPRRVPDLTKIRTLLGYEPRVHLDEILDQRRRVLHVGPGAGLTGDRPPSSATSGKLASHSAVYGAADVFTTVVNLLLIPLYTTYLGATEYGNLALLLLFATAAKIVFRLGLDAGFFRVHYDMDDRRRPAAPGGHGGAVRGRRPPRVLMAAVVLLRGPAHPRAPRRGRARGLGRAGGGGRVPGHLRLRAPEPAAHPGPAAPLLRAVRGAPHREHRAEGGAGERGARASRAILWADLAATGAFAARPGSPSWSRNAAPRVLACRCCATCSPSRLPKVPHGLMRAGPEPGRPQDPRRLRDPRPRSGSTTWATPSAAG